MSEMTGNSDEMDTRRAQIDKFALGAGALVVGVAKADAFSMAPEGFRPSDILPNARSVVVVGGASPREGDWQSPRYEHMETTSISDRIQAVGNRISDYIEKNFKHYAINVPPGVDRSRRPFLSLSLAAELAGCGSRSLAGPVLNAEFGFMYYAAIITTLELAANEKAAPVCPTSECVDLYKEIGRTPCMAVCPLDDGGCISGTIEDGKLIASSFDRARCTTRVETYWIPGFQKALTAALDEPDKEQRKMIIGSTFFTRTLWSMTYANVSQGQCFECMRVCPAARVTGKLK